MLIMDSDMIDHLLALVICNASAFRSCVIGTGWSLHDLTVSESLLAWSLACGSAVGICCLLAVSDDTYASVRSSIYSHRSTQSMNSKYSTRISAGRKASPLHT
jgi:hypothetical protein